MWAMHRRVDVSRLPKPRVVVRFEFRGVPPRCMQMRTAWLVLEKSGGDVSVEDLRIHAITVDGGPIIKRWMPRSMGRANRIQHRTSHLTVVVSDEK